MWIISFRIWQGEGERERETETETERERERESGDPYTRTSLEPYALPRGTLLHGQNGYGFR